MSEYEGENLKLYAEAVEESLKNAERWIMDAQLLMEDGSFGHACALACFGLEETTKAVLCWYVSEGIWPEDNILTKNAFKSHKTKNQAAIGLALNILWQTQPIEKRIIEELREPTEEEIVKALKSFEKMPTLMEERRKRAIYVGLENNKVLTPCKMDEKEVKAFLRGVDMIFKVVKYYMKNYPDSRKEKLREYFRSLPDNVWKTGDFLRGMDDNE